MMQRKIDIANYLPNVIKEIKEFQEISKTENPEISLMWDNVQNVFDDQFINTATENGIKRWEKILKIIPKSSHTLEDRAFTVLTRLNEQLPYTHKVLQNLLSQLCGPNGYVLNINHGEYEVSILVEIKSKNMVDAVADLTKKIIPANMDINIRIRYNQHSTLKQLTHGQLKVFTHDQLRNEVIVNGN